MRWIAAIAAIAAVSGCGDCDPEDIDGTYKATTSEISGDCGDLGVLVVQYNKGEQTTESHCAIDYERLSDDQCTADRSVTCANPDGTTASGVGVVTQEPGGERASGTLSMTLRDSAGRMQCMSTYDVTYERQ